MPQLAQPVIPPNATAREEQRLRALAATGLLDSAREALYDEIAQLAASLCQVPICLITLVDRDRQWFKAVIGLSCRELPRESSVCAHTIHEAGPLVVPDLLADSRFRDSPLVRGEGGMRFYAGVPLRASGGEVLGALCAIDYLPRTLTAEQLRSLVSLGRQVEALLVLRQQVQALEAAAAERWVLSRELQSSEARFRAFMDHSPAAAYIKDAEGRMQYYNHSLATLYGVSREAWIGRSDHELWPAEMADAFRRADLEVLARNREIEVEERTPAPDGGFVFWKSYKFPFTDGDGRRCLAGMSIDVTREREIERRLLLKETRLRAANARLEELSMTDPLTGVGNRRLFDLTLERELAASRDTGRPLSLLMLDIDHFKQLNDVHGHAHGDKVLRHMGKLLDRMVRRGDRACRYGGEEFALFLPDTGAADAMGIAERVTDVVAARDWGLCPVTVSLGVATYTGTPGEDGPALSRRADDALYAAKRAGRNRALFAPPGIPALTAGAA